MTNEQLAVFLRELVQDVGTLHGELVDAIDKGYSPSMLDCERRLLLYCQRIDNYIASLSPALRVEEDSE